MTQSHSARPIANRGERLLAWYDRNHRTLPWRVTPGAARAGARADPYLVWLSEIMLQQTTVTAVKPYFEAFAGRWPNVRALAAAQTDDVMKAWAGLGYYSRARNLKTCADTVARDHGGRFPQTVEGLKALPGIGDYTAAAIAAIAFDVPAPVVDGNVERVVARLHAIETPLPQAKPRIRERVAAMMPRERPGDFAQAMMDLGATICTPRRPSCILCPLRDGCRAQAEGAPERFPVRAAKADKRQRRGAAFVAVRADGAILLRKRATSGLLGAMSEVPMSNWSARKDGETGESAAPFPARWQSCGQVSHVFTHFALDLDVYRAQMNGASNAPAGCWWSAPVDLADEALPSLVKKVIEKAVPGATRWQKHAKGRSGAGA
jgi:A/G-specific adenine glycosylase